VDFSNVVLIMTSNLPGEPIDYFRPEFVNRIDEIVRFRSLTRDDLAQIVEIQLEHIVNRLADRRITLQVTPSARTALAEQGFDESFGARPLKRLIQREIADKAALLILEGSVGEDGAVRVDAPEGVLEVRAV
jgi:ATP-dependent Clp protease ATP-binding subunit ClpB